MSTSTLWSGSPQSKGFLTMPTTGPDTGWMLMMYSEDELSYLTAVKIKDFSQRQRDNGHPMSQSVIPDLTFQMQDQAASTPAFFPLFLHWKLLIKLFNLSLSSRHQPS